MHISVFSSGFLLKLMFSQAAQAWNAWLDFIDHQKQQRESFDRALRHWILKEQSWAFREFRYNNCFLNCRVKRPFK